MTNPYVDMYCHFAEIGTDSLLAKVKAIREGIAAGVPKDELLAACGKESGDRKTQVLKFYAVAMCFPEDKLAHDFDYWTHQVCATAPGVDPDDPTTYGIAHDWMTTAVGGHYVKRGKKMALRKHTARTLRKLIAGDRVGEKPEVVLSKVKGAVTDVDFEYRRITLFIDVDDEFFTTLNDGLFAPITVTITRTPQSNPVTVADVETEAA